MVGCAGGLRPTEKILAHWWRTRKPTPARAVTEPSVRSARYLGRTRRTGQPGPADFDAAAVRTKSAASAALALGCLRVRGRGVVGLAAAKGGTGVLVAATHGARARETRACVLGYVERVDVQRRIGAAAPQAGRGGQRVHGGCWAAKDNRPPQEAARGARHPPARPPDEDDARRGRALRAADAAAPIDENTPMASRGNCSAAAMADRGEASLVKRQNRRGGPSDATDAGQQDMGDV